MKLRYKFAIGIPTLIILALTSLAFVLSHTSPCEPAYAPSIEGEQMKAIVGRCYGSPDVLELVQVAKPIPADNEVLVKVHAASVNPLDWHYMRGAPYFMRLMSGLSAPTNIQLGVDFSGTVESIGKDVTRFAPGDDVFGGGNGSFSEYVTVREGGSLTLKPTELSFEQAASMPIAGVTALQALRDLGQLKPGQKVLINGASGGVGTFAVQVAKAMGAEVTGVCSSRNAEMVRSLGADHVIDYKVEDYTERGKHYDLIIDNVGNHSPGENLKVLTPKGVLVTIGGPKGDWIGPITGMIKAMFLSPFVDQEMLFIMAVLEPEDLGALADLTREGKMTPVIDRRYSLAEVPEAIRYSELGHAKGKIIINID